MSNYCRSCRQLFFIWPIQEFYQESLTAWNMTRAMKAVPSILLSSTLTGTLLCCCWSVPHSSRKYFFHSAGVDRPCPQLEIGLSQPSVWWWENICEHLCGKPEIDTAPQGARKELCGSMFVWVCSWHYVSPWDNTQEACLLASNALQLLSRAFIYLNCR